MPKITLHDGKSFDVENGKRLILALEDHDVDILHRCGGHANCTTCRVKFHAGEPDQMTIAEYEKLSQSDGLLGVVRLSCQITCTHDMEIEPLMSLENSGMNGRGNRPDAQITPPPIWMESPQG